MPTRTRYLVAYDIRDERRLRRVAQCVEGFGSRVQYSVFVCDLSEVELIRLRLELRDVLDHRTDSVMFVNLGPPEERGTHCFEFLGAAPGLPQSGGPTIL